MSGHLFVRARRPSEDRLRRAAHSEGHRSRRCRLVRPGHVTDAWREGLVMRRHTNTYSIRHVDSPSARIAEAHTALNLSIDCAKQFETFSDRLAKQKIAERKVMKIAAELWPDCGTDRQSATRTRAATPSCACSSRQRRSATRSGTKWCAANALLEQLEWGTRRRTPEGRYLRHVSDPDGLKALRPPAHPRRLTGRNALSPAQPDEGRRHQARRHRPQSTTAYRTSPSDRGPPRVRALQRGRRSHRAARRARGRVARRGRSPA